MINKTATEARESIINFLKSLDFPENYKFILRYNTEHKEVEINLYKFRSWKIGKYNLFQHWELKRNISGEDYEDLLEIIYKYPKFIETEVEIKCQRNLLD